jgi:hypothetical protein
MSYAPRLDTASESGSGALAAIYRRAIERYEEKQKGGPEAASDDGPKSTGDSADAVRR